MDLTPQRTRWKNTSTQDAIDSHNRAKAKAQAAELAQRIANKHLVYHTKPIYIDKDKQE